MPAAAPDDPAAYRGVRYRPGGQTPGVRCCEAGVPEMPWLRVFPSSLSTAGRDGLFFGYQQVADGRRRMVWFFRLVEPLTPPPTATVPPLSGSSAEPPAAYREPLRAVLDVVALPGEPEQGLGVGCAPDPAFIVGKDGWRLNRTTSRAERIDPDDAECRD
jgi:hypothetical protein